MPLTPGSDPIDLQDVVTEAVTAVLKKQMTDLRLYTMAGTLDAVGQGINEFEDTDRSTIKPFNGHNQNPQKWIERFLAYTDFRCYKLPKLKAFLGLSLEGSAATWYEQNKIKDLNTAEKVKEELFKRFVVANSWLDEQKIYTLMQQSSQSVRHYYDTVIERCLQ